MPDPNFQSDADPDPTAHFSQIWTLQNDPLRLPPFHFDADPDPSFHFDPNQDPAFHFDADPDPHLDPAFQNDADPQHCLPVRKYTVTNI